MHNYILSGCSVESTVYHAIQFAVAMNPNSFTIEQDAYADMIPYGRNELQDFIVSLVRELSNHYGQYIDGDYVYVPLDGFFTAGGMIKWHEFLLAVVSWANDGFKDNFASHMITPNQPVVAHTNAPLGKTSSVTPNDQELLDKIKAIAKRGLDKNPSEFWLTPAVKALSEIYDLI